MLTFADPKITRVILRDPLDPTKRAVDRVEPQPAMTVAELCPPEMFPLESTVFVHNGKTLTRAEAATAPVKRTDSVVFAVGLGGSGGTGVAIGLGIALVGVGILTGGFGLFAATAFMGSLGLGLLIAGGSMVLSSIVQGLLTPKVKSDTAQTTNEVEDSPTYQLEGIRNTYAPGLPISIPYGRHRVGGQVIQQSLEVSSSGKTTAKMLVSLGHGPIHSVAGVTADTDNLSGTFIPEDIEINGSPARNFQGVNVSVRLGGYNQTPIPGFNEVVTSQSAGLTTLTSASPQTLTTTTAVEAFQVNFFFPAGLYRITPTGTKLEYTVQYWLRWRETGTSAWYKEELLSISKNKTAAFSVGERRNQPLGADMFGAPIARVLDVQIERVTQNDFSNANGTTVSILQWNTLNEITSGDLSYPGIALIGFELLGTDQLQGTIPTVSTIIEGRKLWVWDGASTTAPAFASQYTDGKLTKDNRDGVVFGWSALRAAVGPPIVNEKISFQFTQDGSRTLNLVAVKMRRSSTTNTISGNVYVTIEGNSSGNPNGVVAATSEVVACNTLTAEGSLVYFGFASPPSLTHGTVYHAVIQGTYTPSATINVQVGLETTPSGGFFPPDLETYTNPTWSNSSTESVIGFVNYKNQTIGENPAWWILDVLTNKNLGLGEWVTLDDIDLDSLLALSDYNEECWDLYGGALRGPRWAGGLIIDFHTSGWEIANKIAALCRASLVKIGRKIYFAIDKPTSPTQLFTEGNINRDSVTVKWLGIEDRPNRVEVQYKNDELGFNADVAAKEDAASLDSGDSYRSEIVNVFGLTAPWRAFRTAQYRVNVAQTNRRLVSFSAGVDAVAVLPGDVFAFQHKLQDSSSAHGRVAQDVGGGTPTLIAIDRPLDATWTTIKVRTKSTGAFVLQERTLINAADITNADTGSTYSFLQTSVAFDGGDLPKAGDPYVVTASATTTVQYRCIGVKMNSDLTKIEILGLEYNTSVYDDDPGDVPEFTDELPNPNLIDDAEDVEHLTLREVHQQQPDGGLETAIEVCFDKPRSWGFAEIYYRDPAAYNISDGWTYAGSTRTDRFLLTDDAEVRRAYLVAVVSVSQSGARKHPSQSPQEVISINGPFCQPPNVSSFRAVLTSGLVVLSWAPVATPTPTIASNKDYAALGAVDGYEIRQGTSWSTGRVLTKLASGSMFVLPPPAQSTATYMIRAVSRAGIKSAAAASVSLTEADVYVNSQFNRDESAGGFAGTRTNLTAVGSGSVGMSASSSTYEAAVFSGLTLRRHRVHVDVDALPHDTVETVAEQTWAIGDVQGDRRLVSGWGVNPWDPKPYVLGSDTELDQSLDGWVGRYQNGYAGGRDIEDVASWHLEYSLSTNGGGSYGSWTRFESPVSLVFNAIKIRIEMTGDATPATFAPQQRILLTEMKIRGIREIEVDEGSASTASGGTAVTYNFPFSAMPRVTANVRAGAAGDNVQLSAVNSTGFTARIFDSAGVGKAGSVMWHAVL